MATYDAGDARLKIFPDAGGFTQKLEADLKKVDVDFRIPIHPNLAQASADLERWRQQQQRNPVELKVEVDTATATAKAATLKKTLEGLKLGQNGVGGALLANVGALGIGSLPAAATAIANVAGAVQQLAGAGLALPGALSGIAATVGTVKVGLTGVSDAFDAVEKSSDGTAKSIEAANAALAKLAPSAADAVKAAADIKKQLADALVLPTQQNLFDGLGDSARKLVNADLPIVQRGMAGLATAVNVNAKQLLTSLGSDSSQSFLDRIFGNTADAQTRLTGAIDPIVHALGALSAAGSDALPRLADGVGKVADRFDKFITAADGDGRLDKWINDGITGLSHLGETVLNIGKSFTAITQAAGGDGGLLSTLDSLTGQLATFLNSDEGQAQLANFFKEGREQLAQWGPILQNIAGVLPGIYAASKQWTDTLLPPLEQITGFLADHPRLIQAVATSFLAWKTLDFASGILGGIGSISNALGERGKGGLLGKLGIAIGMLDLLNRANTSGAGPNDGPNFQQQGMDAATGALIGSQVFGVPGALIGGAAAATIAPTTDLLAPRTPSQNGVLPTAPNSSNPATVGGIPIPGLLIPTPGKANGGVLPGYSPGVDNLLVPMSGGEGVIIPQITRKLGPSGIDAINRGALTRGYATGGIVDPFGNPITPGAAPGPGGFVPGAGPAPVAANPAGANGGIGSILSSVASGIQGPIGNALSLGSSLAGGGGQSGGTSAAFMDRLATIPGVAGLIGSAGSSNPAAALSNWGQQTAQWLGTFAANTATSFGSTLWQGALGAVGLDNSILSPNNPWFQAGSQAAGFALGSDGPIGTLLGAGGSSSTTDPAVMAVGTQHLAGDRASLGAGTSQSGIKVGSGAGAGIGKGGAARWRPVIVRALQQIGPRYGITNIESWARALEGQIQFESGGNSKALNPNDSDGLPAIGLGQFKAATFAAHNITGGSINDGTAQIYAMIDYVARRYGQSAAGVPNYINQGHGYARGGIIPGYSPGVDNMLVPMSGGEGVIVPDVTRQLGPAGIAAINRGALTKGFALGGIIPQGVVLPPQPSPSIQAAQAVAARQITAPGGHAQVSDANLKQLPAPVAPPAPPAPGPLPAPPAPGFTPGVGAAPISTPPTGDALNHNLSAINTGISSAASAIGQAASTAIGAAAGAGAGAAGIPGIGAAGAIGPYVAGLIQQGGKIVSDVVNVGSSFLVGSVPGNLQQGPAQGELMTSPQNVPNTATDNRRVYNISGVDSRNIVDDLRLKDAQDSQGELARFRG